MGSSFFVFHIFKYFNLFVCNLGPINIHSLGKQIFNKGYTVLKFKVEHNSHHVPRLVQFPVFFVSYGQSFGLLTATLNQARALPLYKKEPVFRAVLSASQSLFGVCMKHSLPRLDLSGLIKTKALAF